MYSTLCHKKVLQQSHWQRNLVALLYLLVLYLCVVLLLSLFVLTAGKSRFGRSYILSPHPLTPLRWPCLVRKAVILSLFIHCLLLLPLAVGFVVLGSCLWGVP